MACATKEASYCRVIRRSDWSRRCHCKTHFPRLPARHHIRGDCFGDLWTRYLALEAFKIIKPRDAGPRFPRLDCAAEVCFCIIKLDYYFSTYTLVYEKPLQTMRLLLGDHIPGDASCRSSQWRRSFSLAALSSNSTSPRDAFVPAISWFSDVCFPSPSRCNANELPFSKEGVSW
jgi:hypothetical protein